MRKQALQHDGVIVFLIARAKDQSDLALTA